ncbi:MAG: hypothetical protein JW976_14425 [Syntrophaceae bacterium]|nr:hypothetical protein [Syntrophaceae bacterium]
MKFKIFCIFFIIVVFSLSICFSKQPNPKEWESLGTTGNGHYFNKTNISKSPDIISVWTYHVVTNDERKKSVKFIKKYDLEKSIKFQKYDHNVILMEIDCKKRLYRGKTFIYYDNMGKVLEKDSHENSQMENIQPESPIEGLYKKVCVTQEKSFKKK